VRLGGKRKPNRAQPGPQPMADDADPPSRKDRVQAIKKRRASACVLLEQCAAIGFGVRVSVMQRRRGCRSMVQTWSTSTLLRNLRLINICNGCLMITLALVACIPGVLPLSITRVTVAVYILCVSRCCCCGPAGCCSRSDTNRCFHCRFFGIGVCCSEARIPNLEVRLAVPRRVVLAASAV
jgi:hypothetical protein